MQNERRIANTSGIYSLLINWAISVGALVVVPIISMYVSKLWVPLYVFLLETLLYFLIRFNASSKLPSCLRVAHLAMLTLFWTTLIILVIILLRVYLSSLIPSMQIEKNVTVLYIPVLIISSLMILLSLVNLRLGNKSSICIDCQAHNGVVAERGFLGKLYSQEGDYLTKLFLLFGVIYTIISWSYYSIFYINTNINDIDRFIFVWGFVLIYVISLIYLGIRYWGLWLYYCQNVDGKSLRYNSSSFIRYLIICENSIFIKSFDTFNDNTLADECKMDTPARLYVQYKHKITNNDAVSYFESLSGLKNVDIRFLYENSNFNTECNIFHYAYIVDNTSVIYQSRLEGEWYSLNQIHELIAKKEVSSIFVSELERIFRIAISRKCYDKRGYRLYDIKNYKPTFVLSELNDKTLDFNDILWLFISNYNEDKPFFRLKKFWNKYICGLGILK